MPFTRTPARRFYAMTSVFIVDDDELIHKVLDRLLVAAGFRISAHAFNGAEAVEKFVRMNPKPDIILMDHRMPVTSGVDATREILRLAPSTRVLFVSADETVKGEALAAGAVDFLTKPIRSAVLFDMIKKYTSL
jgi:two-component system chemotaxis response regulator CheY